MLREPFFSMISDSSSGAMRTNGIAARCNDLAVDFGDQWGGDRGTRDPDDIPLFDPSAVIYQYIGQLLQSGVSHMGILRVYEAAGRSEFWRPTTIGPAGTGFAMHAKSADGWVHCWL